MKTLREILKLIILKINLENYFENKINNFENNLEILETNLGNNNY